MSQGFFVMHLLEGQAGWRVSRINGTGIESQTVPLGPEESVADVLPAVVESLRQLGYDRQECLLSVSGSRVFTAAIDLLNLPRRNRRPAMIYRLEDQLPLEAERLTVDFLSESKGRCLAVAAETQPLKDIVDRLTENGIEISCICPRSLLVLRYLIQADCNPGQYLLVVDGEQADLLRTCGPTVTAWYTVTPSSDEIIQAASADLLISPVDDGGQPAIHVAGELPAAAASEITATTGLPVVTLQTELPERCADLGAAMVLSADGNRSINLRRDGLAPTNLLKRVLGHLRVASILVLTLLAVAAGSAYWRSVQYAEVADELERCQTTVYQKAYPSGQVPPVIRSRLQSELMRFSAVSGENLNVDLQRDSLDVLRLISENLPKQDRYRLTSLRISASDILLEGQATSHTTAERIAQAMRSGGLEFNPPTTERLPKNIVGFTLSGKPAAKSQDDTKKIASPKVSSVNQGGAK